MGKGDRARVGESNFLAGPVEQRLAEVELELADLRADAGLADVHALGGPGEVRGFDDGDEILQLANIHNQ